MGKQKDSNEHEGTEKKRAVLSGDEEKRNTSNVGIKAAQKASRAQKTAGTSAKKAGKKVGGKPGEVQKKTRKSIAKAGKAALDRAADIGKKAKQVRSGAREKLPEVQKQVNRFADKAGKGILAAGRAVGEALKITAKASGKLAGVVNVKAEMAAENRRLRSLLQRIGEQYYAMKRGETPGAEADIDSLTDEVTKVKQEIQRLENKEKKIRSRPL
jgi:hypothetical protein